MLRRDSLRSCLCYLVVSDERRKTKVIGFLSTRPSKKREAVVQQKFPALFLSTALENPVLSRATSLVGTFSRASKWNHRESAVFSDLRIVSLDIRRNESRAQGARHTPSPFLHLPPKPFFSWRKCISLPDSLFDSCPTKRGDPNSPSSFTHSTISYPDSFSIRGVRGAHVEAALHASVCSTGLMLFNTDYTSPQGRRFLPHTHGRRAAPLGGKRHGARRYIF